MFACMTFKGTGIMELLLILTSPFWPLALLAGIESFHDLTASGQRKPVSKIPGTSDAFEEDGEFGAQPAAPPRFVVRPASFPEIARKRVALSHERVRLMGLYSDDQRRAF